MFVSALQPLLRRHFGGRPVLGTTALCVGALTLTPLVYLFVRAFDGGTEKVLRLLLRQRTLDLVVRTATLALTVVVASVVVGTLLAWLTVRTDLPGRRIFSMILAAPLAIPSYVSGYLWIAEFPSLAGFSGAALVLTLSCFPLVMLPVMEQWP